MTQSRTIFDCIDGHTCGNPVRLVTSGHPELKGKNMSEKRVDFMKNHDWIRKTLMYEPRGHDVMSGTFLYPSTRPDCDIAVLYIEVSGCLPMCGHATIGTVTFIIENDLVTPKVDGVLSLDTPGGKVVAFYEKSGDFVEKVHIHNVPSFLAETDITIDCPELGELVFDISYGGNFYAIFEPQKNYGGLDNFTVDDILKYSPIVRKLINEKIEVYHPEDRSITGVKHLLWAGEAKEASSHGRCAVFYGDKAIDRSPCGTGTSARMAQLFARGDLKEGDDFIHESIIGTIFEGRVEEITQVGQAPAIRPSIAGWARQTGVNKIFVDDRDPFKHGFQVK